MDTIVAQATAPGRGGVGIVRVSGSRAKAIALAFLGFEPQPRYAHYGAFLDAEGQVMDMGLGLFFPNPHSFTGEDVFELQGHGGPVILQMLLNRCIELGARAARPGEFSERAYLNDKLDLAQAEAVLDLIHASSEQAARSALKSLQGEFSQHIHELVEQLIHLRMYVESAIDFPEEEIDFLNDGHVASLLDALNEKMQFVLKSASQGRLLREGMTVVIMGQPNAGKSSLLNQLAGREVAIVTDIEGTTRDVVREEIHIDGMPLHILDTAGLRDSSDAVEQEGIRRAWAELEQADRVLLMVSDAEGVTQDHQAMLAKMPPNLPVTVVRNKIDQTDAAPSVEMSEFGTEVRISAKQALGLEGLKAHLKESMGFEAANEGSFMARARHIEALKRAENSIQIADQQLRVYNAGELVAEDLRQAQEALSEITGEFTSDDLLGEIFSSFCIGK